MLILGVRDNEHVVIAVGGVTIRLEVFRTRGGPIAAGERIKIAIDAPRDSVPIERVRGHVLELNHDATI